MGAETMRVYSAHSSSSDRWRSAAAQLRALKEALCSKLIGCGGTSTTRLLCSEVVRSITVRMMCL